MTIFEYLVLDDINLVFIRLYFYIYSIVMDCSLNREGSRKWLHLEQFHC